MAKYRKKPVVIEAFKWTGEPDQIEDPEWIIKAFKTGVAYFEDEVFKIHTLEGDHTVSPGDYVIKGISGELYPCKPDIFQKTYEKAE
ncbi:hypothetical protein NIE88_04860 [Sporolactobacillus shoreicorticis]|uniref:Phage protein n=1 Tax=Sporolactobacillus shoreicorticis TaxID=1923877 RepID=A0ABW5S0A9_9BACL|nr:hypothetical protein [Sporolactobacillus shoreicorticis]MCO7125104.1 hypothetical protein [Sporolactobacillus shoreicorticis]